MTNEDEKAEQREAVKAERAEAKENTERLELQAKAAEQRDEQFKGAKQVEVTFAGHNSRYDGTEYIRDADGVDYPVGSTVKLPKETVAHLRGLGYKLNEKEGG